MPNDMPTAPASPEAADGRPPAFLLTDAPRLHENGNGHAPALLEPAILETIRAGQIDPAERPQDLPLVIESLLLVAEEPPTLAALARATNVSPREVERAIEHLLAEGGRRGIRVQRDGSSVRLISAPEATPYIQQFLGIERPNKLSRAALETLAIIAYRQPVTRLQIDSVRGVNCDGALATLRLRDLIQPVGQSDAPGRPYFYGTTPHFLEHFGLQRIGELPPLPDQPLPAAQGSLPLDAEAEEAGEAEAGEPLAASGF